MFWAKLWNTSAAAPGAQRNPVRRVALGSGTQGPCSIHPLFQVDRQEGGKMIQGDALRAERSTVDLRRAMVDNQIRTFDVTDQPVLERFTVVPREMFVPAALASLAYSDAPLALPPARPGAEARVLMVPMFLARLIQGATVKASDRVLVVGAASGYTSAILSGLAGRVTALDSEPDLASAAAARFAALGLGNLDTATGPLAAGHAAGAPYGVIVIDGAVEDGYEAVLAQVAPGGCLVTVDAKSSTATRRAGKAVRFDRIGGEFSARPLFDATVPVLPEFRAKPVFVF